MRRSARAAVRRRQRPARRARARAPCVEPAAHARAAARRGLPRAASARRAPNRCGAARASRGRRARTGRGSARPGAGDRRRAMLPVAAEQLVGALARERDRHVLGRQLARARGTRATRGRRAARRGARRARRGRRPAPRTRARARDDRCRSARRRDARPPARCPRPPRRTRPRTSSPARSCAAPSGATIDARVEPAAQHRAERNVAHQPQPHRLVEPGQQPLRALRSSVMLDGRGLRDTPSTPRLRTPPSSTTSRWPGHQLARRRAAASSGRERSRA